MALGPKIDVGLPGVVRGKPDGPPPMPEKALGLEPVVRTARAQAVTAIACSPWAPLAAVGGQKQILLYNTDTLDLVGVLPFPEGEAHVLKFSRNGGLLIAGGGHAGKSGKVVLWSVKSGERIVEVGDETDAVMAADVSPDQTQVALGGPSKVVRIYSTKDGKLIHEIRKHTDWITALEYSPDGVLLATGDRVGGLFVWEAFTAREYFTLRGHTAAITEISWRSDGNVCASASEDTTVKLWEMENGNAIKSWNPHAGGVESLRYARNGQIATAGRDRTAKLWDGAGNPVRTFDALPDVALRTAFTWDDGRVIAGDWTGQVMVWTAADGKARSASSSPNPPTLAERLDAAQKDVAAKQAGARPDGGRRGGVANRVAAGGGRAGGGAEGRGRRGGQRQGDGRRGGGGEGERGQGGTAAVGAGRAVICTRKWCWLRRLAEASAKVKDAADKAAGDALARGGGRRRRPATWRAPRPPTRPRRRRPRPTRRRRRRTRPTPLPRPSRRRRTRPTPRPCGARPR